MGPLGHRVGPGKERPGWAREGESGPGMEERVGFGSGYMVMGEVR